MPEIKAANPKELISIDNKGFYFDKSENPQGGVEIIREDKNLDLKPNAKSNKDKEIVE